MEDHDKLVEFARWAIRSSCWEGVDLDGGEVQARAEALGLIEETIVTEEDNFPECEPGDTAYRFAGPLAT